MLITYGLGNQGMIHLQEQQQKTRRLTVGLNVKKPAKNYMKKFVKLTNHPYVFNSLTNFENKAHVIFGNRNSCKFAEM